MSTTTALARQESPNRTAEQIVRSTFLAGYREPTRSTYTINLDQWFAWCHENGLAVLEVKRGHIELYARCMEEVRGYSVGTINNKLNTVCMFYKTAHRDEYIEDDPSRWVKKPSVPPGSRRELLTKAEFHRVLDAARDLGVLEHAVMCTLGFTGMRVGEFCALNVEDLAERDYFQTVYVNREKKNKSRDVPLVLRAQHALRIWIGSRTSGPLFLNRNEVRIDRRAVDRVIKRCVKAAGIKGKNITPHSLRHGFITYGMDAGVSDRDMTHSMGYASSKMIYRYYDHPTNEMARHASNAVFTAVQAA